MVQRSDGLDLSELVNSTMVNQVLESSGSSNEISGCIIKMPRAQITCIEVIFIVHDRLFLAYATTSVI